MPAFEQTAKQAVGIRNASSLGWPSHGCRSRQILNRTPSNPKTGNFCVKEPDPVSGFHWSYSSPATHLL